MDLWSGQESACYLGPSGKSLKNPGENSTRGNDFNNLYDAHFASGNDLDHSLHSGAHFACGKGLKHNMSKTALKTCHYEPLRRTKNFIMEESRGLSYKHKTHDAGRGRDSGKSCFEDFALRAPPDDCLI